MSLPLQVRGGPEPTPPSGEGVRGGTCHEVQTVVEATGCRVRGVCVCVCVCTCVRACVCV